MPKFPSVPGAGSPAADYSFDLQPFDKEHAPPISLSGSILLNPGRLQAEFRLHDPHRVIPIPSLTEQRQRRHELWKATCFELFFGAAGADPYLEVNLSPAGHWNLYRFDGYRQGMREEPADCLKYSISPAEDILVVDMTIDLDLLGLKNEPLLLGPSFILLSHKKTISCWATSHPDPRPDFHDRRAWLSFE